MKKNYSSPQVRTFTIMPAQMLATSGNTVTVTLSDEEAEGGPLSKQYQGGLWGEDSYDDED